MGESAAGIFWGRRKAKGKAVDAEDWLGCGSVPKLNGKRLGLAVMHSGSLLSHYPRLLRAGSPRAHRSQA